MPHSYVVAMPYVGPRQNFEEFQRGVENECWPHFIITDNSKDSHLKEFGLEAKGARVIYAPWNDGISRAWNRGLKDGKDFTILISTSMRFKSFAAVAKAFQDGTNLWGASTGEGWHLMSIGRRTVETVGFFDENFWPAYLEDIDYGRRCELAEIHGSFLTAKIHPNHHCRRFGVWPGFVCPDTYCIGNAVAAQAGLVQFTTDEKNSYFRRKWGHVWGQAPLEAYHMKPFGDKPLDYWPEHTIPKQP